MESFQKEAELSLDSLFEGKISCLQSRQGYRFSVDAVLLAHFFTPNSNDRILDLGTGCGIISLILTYRWPTARLCAFELQPALVELATRNAVENSLDDRIQVIEGDLRQIAKHVKSATFDWVVCNPPYGKKNASRLNVNDEKAIARHEIFTDLKEVVKAARLALKDGGRACFVYPAPRSCELLQVLPEHGLEPRRLQKVHAYPGSDEILVLVEAEAAGESGLEVLSPFNANSRRSRPPIPFDSGH